jgi:hypothetical protein
VRVVAEALEEVLEVLVDVGVVGDVVRPPLELRLGRQRKLEFSQRVSIE